MNLDLGTSETMKTSVVTLFVLVVCVGGTYCVLVVAWRGGFFSGNPPNSRSHSYDDLARGPTHRPPVKIKPGSHAGLVARLLHTKHLTPSDRDTFNACQEKHRNSSDEWKLGDCVFINPINRSAVALVSLPGSGNTWLRGLLERATGVCTGKTTHHTLIIYLPRAARHHFLLKPTRVHTHTHTIPFP